MKLSHEKRMLKTRQIKDRKFYDDVVHVPLIISGYGIKKTQTIDTQVGTIDIFPTIFEILEFNPPNQNVNGRSLLTLMNDKKMKDVILLSKKSTNQHIVKIQKSITKAVKTNSYEWKVARVSTDGQITYER